MTTGETTRLFVALRDGVREFRARVEGNPGEHRDDLTKIQDHDGVVVEIVDFVLHALIDILSWLYNAIDDIDAFVLQADAATAMTQTFGVGLQGVGNALEKNWPEGLAAASAVASAVADLGTIMASISVIDLPTIIPDPAVLESIREETRGLLGTRVAPDADPAQGALDRLLQDLDLPPFYS